MDQQNNQKIFALICNSLADLNPFERNIIAQKCIDMNQTTSTEIYSSALAIPKRTVQSRLSKNQLTFIKIAGKKFPSLGIIE